MMIKLLRLVVAGALFIFPSARGQANPPASELTAELTLLTKDLHEDGGLRVRVQIQNIANHPVLIGRDFNRISSVPFRMEIWLEDANGNRLRPTPFPFPAAVDLAELPDLQLKNGLLVWRVPLYPGTFLGADLDFNLYGIPPGKYSLRGKYVINRFQHQESKLERSLTASNVSIFQGVVETNLIQVNVLPIEAKSSNMTSPSLLAFGAGCRIRRSCVCGLESSSCQTPMNTEDVLSLISPFSLFEPTHS